MEQVFNWNINLRVCLRSERWKKGKTEREGKKEAQEQKGERKMARLLVKAENCPKCQPIVYQRGRSTYGSYYSLLAVSPCLFPNTILGHTCHRSPMFLSNCHAHARAHAHTLNAPSTSMSQRPRCPIRRQ